MRLSEALRVATGARIAPWTASCATEGDALVMARPAPVPVNSTFTVVVEADVAGPLFGAERGEGHRGLRPRLVPLFESPEVVLPKSFESGAIHPLVGINERAFSPDEDSSLGFSVISRTFGAIDGSRTMSLRVVRSVPNSLKMSFKNLSRVRRSRRVQIVVNLSSSSAARKMTRKLTTSATIPFTVECDRWPTSAPRMFCRFRRVVKVRASAWAILLNSCWTCSTRMPSVDGLSANEDDSDSPS